MTMVVPWRKLRLSFLSWSVSASSSSASFWRRLCTNRLEVDELRLDALFKEALYRAALAPGEVARLARFDAILRQQIDDSEPVQTCN